MIVKLTPEAKFVCDRCGKEQFPKTDGYFEDGSIREVSFLDNRIFRESRKAGQVCASCFDEFLEIANNFFDEVNKERCENGKS